MAQPPMRVDRPGVAAGDVAHAAAWPARLYLLVVSGFTSWVGAIGYWRPDEILRALPWPLPPLHARIVGALYLSATVFLWLAAASRQRLAARGVLVIAFVWTGALLLVSLLHWRSFDPQRVQVWFWAVAYLSFPPLAAVLAMRAARWPVPTPLRLQRPDGVARGLLLVQGMALTLLAAALGLWPAAASVWWPWPMPALLAQVYAGPLLGLGLGSLWLAHAGSWPEVVPPMVAQLVFSGLAGMASSWHAAAFAPGSPSQGAWWVALLGLGVSAPVVLAAGRPRERQARLHLNGEPA